LVRSQSRQGGKVASSSLACPPKPNGEGGSAPPIYKKTVGKMRF
jgi:hypothetical protein